MEGFWRLERAPDGVTMTVHGSSGEASMVKGGTLEVARSCKWFIDDGMACKTEQEVHWAPVLTATRARGTWRLRQHASARVVGGFRTFEDVWAYAPRLLVDAA